MKKIVAAVCIILLSINCIAQKKLSVTVSGGTSNLKVIDKEAGYEIGNYYTSIFSFKAGVNYDLFRRDSVVIFPDVGLAITAKGAKNNSPEFSGYEANSWIERFYSLDLPITLNYKFEEFLILRGGINSSLVFATPGYRGMMEKRLLTFGLLGGATIRLKSFTLKMEYIYDFSDMLQHSEYNISYRNAIMHFGAGYYF